MKKNIIKIIKEDEKKPMSDDEIRRYLHNVPIIAYSKLKDYNDITELLPNNYTYALILYEDSPNEGHWTGLLRYDDTIEYFDSYGGKIDDPLNWLDLGLRKELDQFIPYLTHLLGKAKNFKITYNKKKFQSDNPTIATCGKHCTFRILNNKKNNMNLKQYIKLMNELKKKTNLSYDEIVSSFIENI